MRKCDGFFFNTRYTKEINNTTDAISRIDSWKEIDKDRFPYIEDNRDIDDDSVEVNKETWETNALENKVYIIIK